MRTLARLSVSLEIIAICLVAAHSAVFAGGTERWSVKVAQDQHNKYFFKDNDVPTGKLQAFQNTTIAGLQSEPYPFINVNPRAKVPQWAYNQRGGRLEFRMWTITVILTERKIEDDEDYHLILHDPKDASLAMVAEIPSPNCIDDTPEPIKSMIILARKDFDNWIVKQTNKKKFNQKVRITGIGFFDRVHGAEGGAPNGVELHPVIKIEFLKK